MASAVSHFRKLEPALVEHRRTPRLPVRITRATVRPKGEEASDAILHDLSIYGCRIMSPMRRREGERLWLRFQGTDPIAATVVWCDAHFAGCRFDEPIARSICKALTLATD